MRSSYRPYCLYGESGTKQSDALRAPEIPWHWAWALIAYGIKLSVEAGFNGDVTLDAKTPELARHYERDFGALLIPGRERGAAPRYLICDEAARDIFVSYLEES